LLNGIKEISVITVGSINKFILLNQLRKNQWLKISELKELQEKKLHAIIDHAYNNTEFYHRKLKNADIRPSDIRTSKDLQKIPITTKNELRKYGLKSMLSQSIDFKKCKLISTSGSTGIPLKIIYDEISDDFSKAVNLRSMIENGLKLRDRWVNIGDPRLSGNKSWFQKLGFYNLITLNIFDDIKKEVETLIEMNPDTIMGYPSQFNLIAQYVKRYDIKKIKPRNIFTTAELLDNKTRNLINSVFNLELIDLFGCIEVNRTAWECSEHQGYHLDIDSVIPEFVKNGENVEPGERGNIIYTCLYNYAMPLIRYDIGDIGVPSDDLCHCGRGLPLMKSVEGRVDDFIRLGNGKNISPRVLGLVMGHSNGIIDYQIVQEKIDRISIYLVISEEFDDNHIDKLNKKVRDCLHDKVSVTTKICNSIKKNSSGKIRKIISNVK